MTPCSLCLLYLAARKLNVKYLPSPWYVTPQIPAVMGSSHIPPTGSLSSLLFSLFPSPPSTSWAFEPDQQPSQRQGKNLVFYFSKLTISSALINLFPFSANWALLFDGSWRSILVLELAKNSLIFFFFFFCLPLRPQKSAPIKKKSTHTLSVALILILFNL